MVVTGSPPIPGTAAVTSAGLSAPRQSGRSFASAENAFSSITRFLAFALLSCVGLQALGLDFADETVTQTLCAALLLLGLPHGTFDWQLHHAGLQRSIYSFALRLALYLGLAAATYLAWQIAPIAALTIFLLIAIFHFAEDWESDLILANSSATKPKFLALAMPISIITLPALSHQEMLRSIFVMLSGDESAVMLVDVMILLAPVATGVATAKIFMDCATGEISRGIAGICVLSAMVILPPIAGFSLYFCLYHSPLHFSTGWKQLTVDQAKYSALIVAGLTIGGLAIAALVYSFGQGSTVTGNLVATAFVTLSLLTVPHMIMPSLVSRRHSSL